MIAKQVLFIGLLGAFMAELMGTPVSFPADRPVSTDIDDSGSSSADDAEARFHHREKKKRKRMKLACLLALHNSRHRRAAHADPAEGEERTLFWGGLNYYNTDIHVYNGGYGNRPSYAPGESSNPCQGLPLQSGFPSLPSFPSLPNLPSIGSIGNEIIHVVNPGSGSSSSSSSSSSGGNRPGFGGGGNRPGLGGGGPVAPAPVTLGGGDGDGDNEDYDYSDGGSDSDDNSNRIKRRRKPAQSSSSLLARPGTYLDYYVFRPIDRTFRQIVRWF